MAERSGYPDIASAVVGRDFETVIHLVREAIGDDAPAALNDPSIQDWLGRRYRNIFLAEASEDQNALKAAKVPLAKQLIDRRSSRELLAARFLKGVNRQESQADMPAAAMPDIAKTTLLFVPGLMTGLLPVMAFQSVWPKIEERFGIRILTADVHPVRRSLDNVDDILRAVEQGRGLDADSQPIPNKLAKPPKDVVIVGYSKGAVDALAFLVGRPEFAPRVRAFVGWAGMFGGSYIVDDLWERIKDQPISNAPLSGQIGKSLRQVIPVVQAERVTSRLEQYDLKAAVEDLTTSQREAFLREHIARLTRLAIPTFTINGVTSLREVPYYQAMGVLALNSHDKYNDMLLTARQSQLPVAHATNLATFRGHHWDLAYDPFPWFTRMGSLNVDHKFARFAAMSALILFLGEIGLLD